MISGIILAGGASRRMGFDKRFAVVSGRTLLQTSIDTVRHLCGDILVCIRPGETALSTDRGVRWIPDEARYEGPLSAITHALRHCLYERCVVHACDMLNVPTYLLRTLITTLDADGSGSDMAIARHREQAQPLPMALRVSCRAPFQAVLDAGHRSLRRTWSESSLRVSQLDVTRLNPATDWKHVLDNINTPSAAVNRPR